MHAFQHAELTVARLKLIVQSNAHQSGVAAQRDRAIRILPELAVVGAGAIVVLAKVTRGVQRTAVVDVGLLRAGRNRPAPTAVDMGIRLRAKLIVSWRRGDLTTDDIRLGTHFVAHDVGQTGFAKHTDDVRVRGESRRGENVAFARRHLGKDEPQAFATMSRGTALRITTKPSRRKSHSWSAVRLDGAACMFASSSTGSKARVTLGSIAASVFLLATSRFRPRSLRAPPSHLNVPVPPGRAPVPPARAIR